MTCCSCCHYHLALSISLLLYKTKLDVYDRLEATRDDLCHTKDKAK
jgi:hypothetical protein